MNLARPFKAEDAFERETRRLATTEKKTSC